MKNEFIEIKDSNYGKLIDQIGLLLDEGKSQISRSINNILQTNKRGRTSIHEASPSLV